MTDEEVRDGAVEKLREQIYQATRSLMSEVDSVVPHILRQSAIDLTAEEHAEMRRVVYTVLLQEAAAGMKEVEDLYAQEKRPGVDCRRGL